MRIFFSDIARPKAAAKQLSRLSTNVTLARVHEALARGTGYRDWHELARSAIEPDASDFSIPSLTRLVVAVSDALGLESGDVQYALSKARLVGSSPWSIADQLALNMAVVRVRFLGPPARGKPGTIVKVKTYGGTRAGYVQRITDLMHVLYDFGQGGCVPYEAVTPRTPIADFLPARLWLPYGVWTLDDGSEVVFARDYLPLWRLSTGGAERLDPWLWIRGIKSERWFAENTEGDWWRPAGRVPALAYLEKHRIFELPKLANAMRFMFERGVKSIHDSVRLMQERMGTSDVPLPDFAALNSNLLR